MTGLPCGGRGLGTWHPSGGNGGRGRGSSCPPRCPDCLCSVCAHCSAACAWRWVTRSQSPWRPSSASSLETESRCLSHPAFRGSYDFPDQSPSLPCKTRTFIQSSILSLISFAMMLVTSLKISSLYVICLQISSGKSLSLSSP